MGKGTACIPNQNFIQKYDLNEINFSLHASVLNHIIHFCTCNILFILTRLPSACLRIPSYGFILVSSVLASRLYTFTKKIPVHMKYPSSILSISMVTSDLYIVT